MWTQLPLLHRLHLCFLTQSHTTRIGRYSSEDGLSVPSYGAEDSTTRTCCAASEKPLLTDTYVAKTNWCVLQPSPVDTAAGYGPSGIAGQKAHALATVSRDHQLPPTEDATTSTPPAGCGCPAPHRKAGTSALSPLGDRLCGAPCRPSRSPPTPIRSLLH